MRSTPSLVQKTTSAGGGVNLLPLTYQISTAPIGNEEIHGYLAYVSEKVRKKIEATGFGEIQLHIDHIKKRIGQLHSLKKRKPHFVQEAFNFGDA